MEFSGIIEREHMGRVSKPPVAIKMKLMFCLSHFAGMCHIKLLCALSVIAERILAAVSLILHLHAGW
jgi:hypothetical protein